MAGAKPPTGGKPSKPTKVRTASSGGLKVKPSFSPTRAAKNGMQGAGMGGLSKPPAQRIPMPKPKPIGGKRVSPPQRKR